MASIEREREPADQLEQDLTLFIAVAHGLHSKHGSVDDFTEGVLGWYKNHSAEIGAWAEASLIAFSFTPTKLGCDRARIFVYQSPVWIHPGHIARRLHSGLDVASLQRNRARGIVLNQHRG